MKNTLNKDNEGGEKKKIKKKKSIKSNLMVGKTKDMAKKKK